MLLTSVTPPFQFGCSGPLRPHFSLRSSVVNTGSPACFLIGIPYFFSRLDINVLLQPNFSAIDRVLNFLSTYKTRRTSSVIDRKSTRLNSSHVAISYAVFCLKK